MIKTKEEWEQALKEKVCSAKTKIKVFDLTETEIEETDYKEKTATFRFPLKEWYKNQFGAIEGAVTANCSSFRV